jgi:hypothetical protein
LAVKHTRQITGAEASSPTPEIGQTQWNEDHVIENDTITAPMIDTDAVTTAKVQNGAITYAKIQDVSATDRVLGRDSAGAGAIEEITPAALRTMINVADGANNYVHPNHTGDVTSVSDGTQTIASDAVTFAKMQNIATDRLIGRDTAGTGDPEELSPATVKAMLEISKADITDFAHESSHESGGSDALTGNIDAVARLTVRKNSGADVGSRRRLNFIEGTGVTLTIADDSANEETDVTITSTPAGGGTLSDVKEGGTVVSNDRANLDFNGNDFNITDDGSANDADIAINRNAANGIAGLDASGDLAKTEQHPQTAYKDEANDFGTSVQTLDKLEIDDTDATPVADRRLENLDGLIRAMSTADAEGRHFSRASLEQIKDSEVASDAAIAKSKISTSGTFAKADLPSAIAYKDEANDYGTNVQTFDKIEIDDTDASPVADRRLENLDGLIRAMSTADAEGRHISRSSLELITNSEVDPAAAIAYSKLNLANSLVNGDISASAAIALSKIGNSGGANGDLIIYNSNWQRLAVGTDGQVLKVSSGLPAWGTDETGGSATTGYNTPASASVSAINTAIDTTEGRVIKLLSATTYNMNTNNENIVFPKASFQIFDGQHGLLDVTAATWSSIDGLIAPASSLAGVNFIKIRDVRFSLNSTSPIAITNWRQTHGAVAYDTAYSDGNTKQNKTWHIMNNYFEGHENKGMPVIALFQLENGSIIAGNRIIGVDADVSNPTVAIRVSGTNTSTVEGNISIMDNYISLGDSGTSDGDYAVAFQADGNLDRILWQGNRIFYAGNSSGNNTKGIWCRMRSNDRYSNKSMTIVHNSFEDLEIAVDLEIETPGQGVDAIAGWNISDNFFDLKELPAAANRARCIYIHGTGDTSGSIINNEFRPDFDADNEELIGIEITGVTLQGGGGAFGTNRGGLKIQDNRFVQKIAAGTGTKFIPIKGLQSYANIVVKDNENYNGGMQLISNAWVNNHATLGDSLPNPDAWQVGTSMNAGGSASPTATETYTCYHSPKLVVIVGATTIYRNGTNLGVGAGSFTLNPFDTIRVTGTPTTTDVYMI